MANDIETKREKIHRRLDQEMGTWISEKNSYPEYDSHRRATAKARANMAGEAAWLVKDLKLEGITTSEELRRAILEAVESYDNWGWGSSWSTAVQLDTVYWVRGLVRRTLKEIL
jgi:hypothetical protein